MLRSVDVVQVEPPLGERYDGSHSLNICINVVIRSVIDKHIHSVSVIDVSAASFGQHFRHRPSREADTGTGRSSNSQMSPIAHLQLQRAPSSHLLPVFERHVDLCLECVAGAARIRGVEVHHAQRFT